MIQATTSRDTFQSSELSRGSAAVFAAAEDHPVHVTRRDGADLVLMSEREATARQRLLGLAAQLIAVAVDDRGTLADRMANQFPWMLALSSEDQAACASALLKAARASFSTGQAHLAIAELHAWQETAAAMAAGLGNELVDWLVVYEPVARP